MHPAIKRNNEQTQTIIKFSVVEKYVSAHHGAVESTIFPRVTKQKKRWKNKAEKTPIKEGKKCHFSNLEQMEK